MWNRKAMLAGVFAGIASPATVVATPDYPKLKGTDSDRLRSDMGRIGNDFRRAAASGRYVETKSRSRRGG